MFFRSWLEAVKLKERSQPSCSPCQLIKFGSWDGFWRPPLLFVFSVGSFWQFHSVLAEGLGFLREVLDHILDMWPHVTPM